jgi:hypothetical protein
LSATMRASNQTKNLFQTPPNHPTKWKSMCSQSKTLLAASYPACDTAIRATFERE